MRYIRTFDKFNVNETVDMFLMPVDPIKGMADVYGDIWDSMKDYATKGVDFLEEVLNKISDIFSTLVDQMKIPVLKMKEKIESYFGCSTKDLTFEKIVQVLTKKLPSSFVTESRESEMEEHMDFNTTKSIGQKVLSVLQAIFGYNMVGGIAVVAINWVQQLFTGFDLWKWALTQDWIQNNFWLDTLSNPGSRGFMFMWCIVSAVAFFLIGFIKKIDAWIATRDHLPLS